jgi:S-adenosylmethionine:tRNA ribosyltransferase-isomerase
MTVQAEGRLRFELPSELSATEPPEARGLERDEVRLLVAGPGPVRHTQFRRLADGLKAGDLLVVNTSATVAAAVNAARGCEEHVVVHVSTVLDDGTLVVELRGVDPVRRIGDGTVGERLGLPLGAVLTLLEGYPEHTIGTGSRLWRARLAVEGSPTAYLERVARPITYGHLHGRWPLTSYQTVFAREPGSAEMPSAGRPFSAELVTDLVTAGVRLAPVLLHTGVSSLEAGERPLPERYRVPLQTAELVNATRAEGHRVVAVGTTVTRALETVARHDGSVRAGHGWTDLVLGPDRPARVVDGLVTGWHDAAASHLLLLDAVAGAEVVRLAYDAALAEGYLWHEFGDAALLLGGHRP